jgi:6,7-dimethyl-8-ribityllumazine synthase
LARKTAPEIDASARGLRLAVLHAAFNTEIVTGLLAGARVAFLAAGGRLRDLVELELPGAFELPLACKLAAESGAFDAVVALGAVVRGDTDHYEHVAREAAAGLQRAALETRVPIAFGVLTTRTIAQALRRAAPGAENKGGEAARAAIATVHALRKLRTLRVRPARQR